MGLPILRSPHITKLKSLSFVVVDFALSGSLKSWALWVNWAPNKKGLPLCCRPAAAAEWSKFFPIQQHLKTPYSDCWRFLVSILMTSQNCPLLLTVIVATSQAFHQPFPTSIHHQESFSRSPARPFAIFIAIVSHYGLWTNYLPLSTDC